MYTLEMATEKAMRYLQSQGVWLTRLIEVSQKGQNWLITYQDTLITAHRENYTVELDKESGSIIGYRRQKVTQ